MLVLTKVDLSNIHDEKFARPQRSQFQDTLCKPLCSPTAASSPVHKQKPPRNYTANKRNDAPLRVLVINCQSIKNKKYDMEN
jgi:hypothetical protein